MRGLDLFSGAGGMSLGAKLAGISVGLAVECDTNAIRTFAHNFSDVRIFDGKIETFTAAELCFQPDIVFGGPPCQGYSTSNQRTRNKNNPTNWLFEEFLRVVTETRPFWVVVENVKGLLELDNKFFLNAILDGLKSLGYKTSFCVLNAVDHGLPQKRSRLFIVGNRVGKEFSFRYARCKHVCTVLDAIHDLPELENGANVNTLPYRNVMPSDYAVMLRNVNGKCSNNFVTKNSPAVIERYKHIPQGGNWESIPAQLMENYRDRTRCHTGIYKRLRPDEPSVVIGNYRKNMLIHPFRDRGLSVREAARIQSFPDWFEFVGSIGFQQQQVGNAVPPHLANIVFSQILNA